MRFRHEGLSRRRHGFRGWGAVLFGVVQEPQPQIETLGTESMRFSVFARSVLSDEARVSLACRIAEKIAPGRGEVDNEGSLRRLFRRGWVCALAALRSPFRGRLDDHLGDD